MQNKETPEQQQKPTNNFQIFINDIEQDVEEQDIINSLESYGKINSIKLTKTQQQHKFCFVGFESQESAQKLLQDSSNVTIKSKKVGVQQYQQDLVNLNNQAYVFINGLSQDITEKDLTEALNQFKFGEIISVKIKSNIYVGTQAKNHGYVLFKNEQDAQNAISHGALQTKFGKIVCEKYNPAPKNEKCQIVIKNILSTVNKEQLEQQIASEFGVVANFTVRPQKYLENRLMAFVTFQKPEEAEAALNRMNNQPYLQNEPLDVQWYKKEESEDSNVYIKNIKGTVNESTLRQALQKYGEIVSFSLNMPKDSLIQTRYAIVAFKTAESAKELMKNAKKDKSFASLFKDDYPYVTPHLTKQEKSEYSSTKRVNQNVAPLNQQNQMIQQQSNYIQNMQMQYLFMQQQILQQRAFMQQQGHSNFQQQRRQNNNYQGYNNNRQYQNNRQHNNYYHNKNAQNSAHNNHNNNNNNHNNNNNNNNTPVPTNNTFQLPTRDDFQKQVDAIQEQQEKQNFIGKTIFRLVENDIDKQYLSQVPKITGMLVDLDVFEFSEMLDIVYNKETRMEHIQQAIELIESNKNGN